MGAISTWCPRARSAPAVRSPSGGGRVTRSRTRSPRLKEAGSGACLELAAGVGANAHGVGGRTCALRLQARAAVGGGDQAAQTQLPASDRGVPRDGRAAGAVEHGKVGA